MQFKLRFTLFLLCIPLSFFAKDFDAEIVNYITSVTIDQEGRLVKKTTIEIQINKRQGEDMVNILIPYTEKNPVKNLSAQIVDLKGNIVRKLKKKDIIDRNRYSYDLYNDEFVKTFDLKHNIYPYRIQYSYTIFYAEFTHLIYWNPLIHPEYPTLNSELNVSVPKDFGINYYENKIQKQTFKEDAYQTTYSWEVSFAGDLKEELYAPPKKSLIPFVYVIPKKFKYGPYGSNKTWVDFGNWIYELNKSLDILPESEKRIINKLLEGIDDDKEKIQILYSHLQENCRYINVAIDIGRLKPYPAMYVCNNRYGDCKALTNYMKAILKYAGIKSYYSLVYAGDKINKIIPEFPSNQFNHVILFVPLQKDTIWLECTNSEIPAGYIGTFTQGRYALVVDKDKSKLIKTPELTMNKVMEKRHVTISNKNQTDINVEIVLNVKGYMFELLTGIKSHLNEDEQEEFIHEIIPFTNYELIQKKITLDEDACAELFLQLNKKNLFKSIDNILYAGLSPTILPDFEKPHKRNYSVQIDYPKYIKDSVVYGKIKEYSPNELSDTALISKFGEYRLTHSIIDDELIVNKTFQLFKGEYPPEDYSDLYSFIQDINKIERKNPVVFTKK
jgi:hypothetical protein